MRQAEETHHWYSASTMAMGRPLCATLSRQIINASCSSRNFSIILLSPIVSARSMCGVGA